MNGHPILAGAAMAAGVLLVATIVVAMLIRQMLRSRRHHGSSGTLGSAMLEVQSLLEPSRKQVQLATDREKAEDREDEDKTEEP